MESELIIQVKNTKIIDQSSQKLNIAPDIKLLGKQLMGNGKTYIDHVQAFSSTQNGWSLLISQLKIYAINHQDYQIRLVAKLQQQLKCCYSLFNLKAGILFSPIQDQELYILEQGQLFSVSVWQQDHLWNVTGLTQIDQSIFLCSTNQQNSYLIRIKQKKAQEMYFIQYSQLITFCALGNKMLFWNCKGDGDQVVMFSLQNDQLHKVYRAKLKDWEYRNEIIKFEWVDQKRCTSIIKSDNIVQQQWEFSFDPQEQ